MLRQWNGDGDGLMELAHSRLDADDCACQHGATDELPLLHYVIHGVHRHAYHLQHVTAIYLYFRGRVEEVMGGKERGSERGIGRVGRQGKKPKPVCMSFHVQALDPGPD